MTKLALAYGRQSVSRNRDDRDGGSVSIAYQREASERWATTNDATLAGWFQDVDESGANEKRFGINDLLTQTKAVRPSYVIFWDLKRLVRDLRFFLDMFALFEEVGAELVSCTEGTRHPAFVWKLLALVGQEERERIAINITHGKRESAKRGRHLGYAPIGYQLTDESELVIDPDRVWIVEWIFERALAGENPTSICRAANQQGIPTPGRSAQWSNVAIARVLRCPTYAGMVEAGVKSASKYGKSLPVIRAAGTHAPIISLPRWQTVQNALDGASRASARRGSTHWLAGRVRCASCGSRLYYVDASRKDTRYRDQHWRCAASYSKTFGRDLALQCPASARRIADRALMPLVYDALYAALTRTWSASDVWDLIEDGHARAARSEREALERELATLQGQKVRLTDAVQFGAGDLAEIGQRTREVVDRMDVVIAQLASVPREPDAMAISQAVAEVRLLAEAIPNADDELRAATAVQLGLSVAVDLDAKVVTLTYRDRYAWLA